LRALATIAGDARTIIYVHGIGNKPEAGILKCQWDQALFGFDLGERSRLAYWVNRERYPTPEAGTCASGDLVTGRVEAESVHGPAARAAAPSLREEVAALTANPRRARTLLRMAEALEREPPRDRGPQALGVEARILPLPRFLRQLITRVLTSAFLRDVHDFLFDAVRRARMRASVIERLRPGGGPFVVIAHSQGSMVAYDVLSGMSKRDCDVRLFVTIGSPLGIREVQDALDRRVRLAVPACVARWVNVVDPVDPVAADEDLADDFTPRRAIVDVRAGNADGPRHPHSATGYLKTTAVRDRVREAVRTDLFQPVAGFVIARDVVWALESGAPEQRHPVLIELAPVPEPGSRQDATQAALGPGTNRGRQRAAPTLDAMRQVVVDRIRSVSGERDERLRLEVLRRYVAADLSRAEVESLAVDLGGTGASVKRVWRNGVRRALLEVSAHTVQAIAAHTGYQALGQGIAWAVLDSGVTRDHPHFRGDETIGPTFDCTRRGDPSPGEAPDRHGHGTHVAGIIAGRWVYTPKGGSPRVFSGIAPRATLHVYKVLDDHGSGEDAWIIKALDHIAAENERAGRLVVQGVNLSLGGSFDPAVYGCGHTPLCQELRRLWLQGVLVVLAAGNAGYALLQAEGGTIPANLDLSIGDPANLDEAIAVGSVHRERPHTYGVSFFSSRGPTADGRQKPDLVAPGERIISCRHNPPAKPNPAPDDLYVAMSGTSMAAPHVSGVLAAFLSVRREFIGSPDRVKRILLANATDLGRERAHQGAGLPNLMKMLLST
jgi:subtilisin family serine protease